MPCRDRWEVAGLTPFRPQASLQRFNSENRRIRQACFSSFFSQGYGRVFKRGPGGRAMLSPLSQDPEAAGGRAEAAEGVVDFRMYRTHF
jgi:hypothetical protein